MNTSVRKFCLASLMIAGMLRMNSGCLGQTAPDDGFADIMDARLDSASKILPDVEIQDELEKFSKLAGSTGKAQDRNAILQEFDKLELKYTNGHGYIFVRQLIYYELHRTPTQSTTQAMLVSVLIERLRIDHNSLLKAIAPFADAQDAPTRQIVDGLILPSVESIPPAVPAFSQYQGFLQNCASLKLPLPKGVILKMMERQPIEGLLSCEVVYVTRVKPPFLTPRESIAAAAHTIQNYFWQKKFDKTYGKAPTKDPDAVKAVLQLARDTEWPSRLFTAEMLRQNAELRDEEIVKLLSADSNELVQQVAKRIGK